MCIRDRPSINRVVRHRLLQLAVVGLQCDCGAPHGPGLHLGCLLYTSDAADDLLCVDLGGRRLIQKKNTIQTTELTHKQTRLPVVTFTVHYSDLRT